MPRVYFRVDASSSIGLGHLSRCLVLARQLETDGCNVRILAQALDVDVTAYVSPLPVAMLEVAPDGAEAEVRDAEASALAIATLGGPSVVVVDHYALGATWERAMRTAGHLVVAIDDFRNRRHCADVLVSDSAATFDTALNECVVPTILAGAAYAMVDAQFAPDITGACLGSPLRILVSYGGSDPTMETLKALDAVRLIRAHRASPVTSSPVCVVIGSANPRVAEIASAAADISGVSISVAPVSIAPLLRSSDLFLTSGGHSMIEAVTMGRVAVVTSTAINQELSVGALAARHAIEALGMHDTVRAGDVAAALDSVAASFDSYARSVREQHDFDTLGATRISMIIRSLREQSAT